MAKISGEVDPDSVAVAIASERANPSGTRQIRSEVDAGDMDALASVCQQMAQAHSVE